MQFSVERLSKFRAIFGSQVSQLLDVHEYRSHGGKRQRPHIGLLQQHHQRGEVAGGRSGPKAEGLCLGRFVDRCLFSYIHYGNGRQSVHLLGYYQEPLHADHNKLLSVQSGGVGSSSYLLR